MRKDKMEEEKPLDETRGKSSKKVSEKSTKQELWQAYNQLILELTKAAPGQEEKLVLTDVFKNLGELKIAIGQQLDAAGEVLLKDLSSFNEARNTIAQEKRKMADYFVEQKKALEKEIELIKSAAQEAIEKQKQALEEEIANKKLEQKRQEEEYQYNLGLSRRDDSDQFNYLKAQRERQIAENEEAIAKRQKEIATMEQEIAGIPETIAKEVEKAKALIAKELTERHAREIREAKLDFERDKKIYEIKIVNLEATIKIQASEIDKLKNQYVEATKQLKEMAVSVIEGRSGTTAQTIVQKDKEESK